MADTVTDAGMHRYSQMERVVHGQPVETSLAQEMEIIGRRRAFIVTNRSLAASPALARVQAVLGERWAGVFTGVTAHSPRTCVVAGAAAARAAGADVLIALGGGSVIDAAKAMLLCLRHGYSATEQLEPHANVRAPDFGHAPDDAARWLRVIAVPTTLSGAEFASSAGLTDTEHGLKHAFVHPMMMPQSVMLDPSLTLATPLPLLLSTGIKAVDHAVERVTTRNANAFSDAVSLLALEKLGVALRRLNSAPQDLHVRAELQYGMFMSLAGSAAGVAVNVSHAIGHVLGAHAGVGHGDTSCVLLPAVLRWNRAACEGPQARIAQALGQPQASAAQAVADLVADLGLPGRLEQTPLKRTDFDAVADKTLHEALLANSRKPVGRADVIEILESAW